MLSCLQSRRWLEDSTEGNETNNESSDCTFTKKEIEKAINSSNHSKVCLEAGTTSKTYLGTLPSGQKVAVKHIHVKDDKKTLESFYRELDFHSCHSHRNLVRLLGHCMETHKHYLVFEYCINGDLAQKLSSNVSVLSWADRVKILRGFALALRYLHYHPDEIIIHRDIMLKNILLTKNMEAKLSSFTLSKTLPKDETKVFTEVAGSGSMAYMDPEYMIGGMLSSSSDIYGFGVVTLQVLSGDVGAVESIATRNMFIKKAKDVYTRKYQLSEFVDPRLNGNLNMDDCRSILDIAVLCIASTREGRPTIEEVFKEIDRAWENTKKSSEAIFLER